MKTFKRRAAGFTLLELMIVVAIVAILSAIAIPSYRKYVLRAHRTDATRALQDMASREENYYFNNNTYPKSATSLGTTFTTPNGYYLLNIPASSATNYTITAVPQLTQAQDTACGTFSLNHAGVQSVTGTSDAVTCWQGH
jgi:type IV pilus assembly protein PilE